MPNDDFDLLDQVEDKILALYKYAQRNLKDDSDNLRSYYFINALSQLPRGNFMADEVAKRATSWLQKMRATPAMNTTDPFEVEILPYERLWEIGMQLLAKKLVRE